jgi:hypothetical protein
MQFLYYFKSCRFWDITPCSSLKVNGRFGVTLHLQWQRLNQGGNQRKSKYQSKFLDLEDGGDMFLRNVYTFLTQYAAL